MYYRNANCAVVVYDITQTNSLEKAKSWIRELQRQADPAIVIALCGNKTDLEARRQVTQEEAQKYAEEEGLLWFETSAKSGAGVSDVFTKLGVSPATYQGIAEALTTYISCQITEECAHCFSSRCPSKQPWATRSRLEQTTWLSSGRRRLQLLAIHSPPFTLWLSDWCWRSVQDFDIAVARLVLYPTPISCLASRANSIRDD